MPIPALPHFLRTNNSLTLPTALILCPGLQPLDSHTTHYLSHSKCAHIPEARDETHQTQANPCSRPTPTREADIRQYLPRHWEARACTFYVHLTSAALCWPPWVWKSRVSLGWGRSFGRGTPRGMCPQLSALPGSSATRSRSRRPPPVSNV